MDNNITVVTAFYDIGRGNLPHMKHGRVLPHYQHRSVDTYLEYFKNLAKLENPLIVYTTEEFAETIWNIRKDYGLEHLTNVQITPNYLPKGMEQAREEIVKIMESPDYYEKIVNPQLIEYWHVDYVLVNIFKSVYVANAIELGLVKTDLTAWIDFGYCRNETTIPPSKRWNYNFDANKVHFFNIREIEQARPIDSIIYTGDVYIMGCHIVAGTKMWHPMRDSILNNMAMLINHKLIDDDQTMLLMTYLSDPDKCELRYVDPSDWFIIFKQFNDTVN